MNLNTVNWKEFKIKDLFRLEPTKGIDSTELLEGNDLSYIGAKHEDNGFVMRCQMKGFESWVSKGNCIVFVQLGAGSAGYANYIPNDFIGMSGKTICGYIDGILNPKIGMFLETVLCKERPKYSFGRSWTGNRLRNTTIKLPVGIDGNPDWHFMECYIESLNFTCVKTNNKSVGLNLDNDKWQIYKLCELFDMERGTRLTIEDRERGKYPFVTAGFANLGVSEYIDNSSQKIFRNCLTLDMFGNCFYHESDFKCDDNILVLKNKNLNKFSGLFIATVISKDKYKSSYGRQYRQKDFNQHNIKLPTKNNQPDWEYMENYIKSLSYGDRI